MLDIKYISKKHKLNSLEKNILEYIVKKIEKKEKVLIREVAKENFTSTSVIYGCIKKIGFTSFSDFIYHIKNLEGKIKNPLEKDSEMSLPIKILKKCEDPLIMFLSTGIANNISSYMGERLTILGKRTILNSHIQLMEKFMAQKILIVAISESGETTSLIDMLEIANKNGIDVISFVGRKNSTIEKLSTYTFVLDEGVFFANVISKFENLIEKI